MIGLVQKAGYGGVLNGTMRLNLDEWEEDLAPSKKKPSKPERPKKEEVGWTLLCPRDEAFKGLNLTRLLADEVGLKSFVRQHIIPVPTSASAMAWDYLSPWARTRLDEEEGGDDAEESSRPLPVTDEATYSSLLSTNAVHGDIVFRLMGSNINSFLVGIKGAKGKEGAADFARVLKWGRTTITSGSKPSAESFTTDAGQTALHDLTLKDNRPTNLRSGVILIDRPLVPYVEGWWATWGQAILLAAVGTLAIKGSMVWFVWWWKGKESEATFEPIGGTEDD